MINHFSKEEEEEDMINPNGFKLLLASSAYKIKKQKIVEVILIYHLLLSST